MINNLPQLGRILTELPRLVGETDQRKKEQKEILRALESLSTKQTRRWHLVVVMGLVWICIAVVSLLIPMTGVAAQNQTILLITGGLIVGIGGLLARKL